MTAPTRVERTLTEGALDAGLLAGLTGTAPARLYMARRQWAAYRGRVGYRKAPARLLTLQAAQHKLSLSTIPSAGLMLTPERGLMSPALADVREAFGLQGAWNLCPRASRGCAAACLSFSGQSGMPAQQRAQAVRTAFLLASPFSFGIILGHEVRGLLRKHKVLALRLNTTSDIRFEAVLTRSLPAMITAGVKVYDYTAWTPGDRVGRPVAYHLTYSAKEPEHTPDAYLAGLLSAGHTVAMPFMTKGSLPTEWQGYPVVDGDLTDYRPEDPAGSVVGLRVKGHKGLRDTSGFIRSIA